MRVFCFALVIVYLRSLEVFLCYFLLCFIFWGRVGGGGGVFFGWDLDFL